MSRRHFDLPDHIEPDHAALQPKKLDPEFHIGVDLGKHVDFSAIAVVERVVEKLDKDGNPIGVPERGFSHHDRKALTLNLRTLEQLPLKTDYPVVVERIKDFVAAPELTTRKTFSVLGGGDFVPREVERTAGPALALDVANAGEYVTDILKTQLTNFIPVRTTGGQQTNIKGGIHHVPKEELVAPLRPAMDYGWLRIPRTLPLYDEFRKQLENFAFKQNEQTGHVSYEAWTEQTHDDLVIAVALAIYSATRRRPQFMTGVFNMPTVGLNF